MADFGISPNTSIELRFVTLQNGRRCIDLNNVPADSGVYVLRFKTRLIGRLIGESSVLKIGETNSGFERRFRSYNDHNWATDYQLSFSKAMLWQGNGLTDAWVIYLLPKVAELDTIVADFYFGRHEHELSAIYLDARLELPPLNLKYERDKDWKYRPLDGQ
jgi:hypothetical protein